MKISTIIKLVFIGIALWGLIWVWQEWNRQADMIRRGQEVGRVCEPPGQPVIANGVEWGCVGDPPYYAVWIPNDR